MVTVLFMQPSPGVVITQEYPSFAGGCSNRELALALPPVESDVPTFKFEPNFTGVMLEVPLAPSDGGAE